MPTIILDPGHSGYYFNASPVVNGYYESDRMWKLTHMLKKELEEWGFTVKLTRESIYDDPELTARGRMAKGGALFLSLHSNAAASEAPDAPWIITLSPDGKTGIDEVSREVGEALGPVVSGMMGVSAPYYYTKSVDFDRDGNGYIDDEYYGVLFGAKSVGVPGVIIEHSFHTNTKAAQWLMSDENLAALAEIEAAALAEFYEIPNKITEDDGMTAEDKVKFEALEKKVEELSAIVSKYERQKVYDNAAIRWAYIDGNLPEWARPTISKLYREGHLKGDEKGSLELSEVMMRLLVILDRAGVFDKPGGM